MLQSIARASSYLTEYEQLREVLAPQPGETLLGAARRLVAERDAAAARSAAKPGSRAIQRVESTPASIVEAPAVAERPRRRRLYAVDFFLGREEDCDDDDYAMVRLQRGPRRSREDSPQYEFYWLSGNELHSRSSDSNWRRVVRLPPTSGAQAAVAAAARALSSGDARGYIKALAQQHDELDALLSESALLPGSGFVHLGQAPRRVVWNGSTFTYQVRGDCPSEGYFEEGYFEDHPGRSNCFIVFDSDCGQWVASWCGVVTRGATLEDAAGSDFAPI